MVVLVVAQVALESGLQRVQFVGLAFPADIGVDHKSL